VPVSAEGVEELRKLGEEPGDSLPALETIPEILAYTVAMARAEGRDECDDVELLCRAAPLSRDEIRKAERVLRALGYAAVCDRLKVLARKAPRPKPQITFTTRWGHKKSH
jgi:hypothetical protein